jgi:predicted MFS family arabinose efflux permease
MAQGAAGAAAAVFAPGMLRLLYRDRVVAALGLFGSIEALAPALAPMLGAVLLPFFGWRGSFGLLAILAALLAVLAIRLEHRLPKPEMRSAGSYLTLIGNRGFVALALSHACALAALLMIVFAAPALFAGPLHGSLADFIVMQVCGVAVFILTANLAGRLARLWGAGRIILAGAALMLTGSILLVAYGAAHGRSAVTITGMFVLVNGGLGLRGPPGFHAAIVAAGGDDARGAAAVVIAMLGVTTLGTATVAPFIRLGLIGPALAAAAFAVLALMLAMLGARHPAPAGTLSAEAGTP